MTIEPRIDAYIAGAAPFARPVLTHLRALVHQASPEIDEAIKWSMPMFLYRGKIVANIAAFTGHAAFGTWQRNAAGKQEAAPMIGRLNKLADLDSLPPDDTIVDLVRTAIAQVDAGGSVRDGRVAKPMPPMPDDLRAALDAVPAAAATFDAFGPGAQREYLDWVIEAKAPATRAKRIATTVEWAGEGKKRNWKYAGCRGVPKPPPVRLRTVGRVGSGPDSCPRSLPVAKGEPTSSAKHRADTGMFAVT
jgi:uncharacterized protein YdeI (YjbR/CyaY-like superfamily)